MDELTQTAEDLFRQGYACSQAVLAAFAPGLGVSREQALKIAAGFGGGMARLGKTCGAASGALMVIGLYFGSAEPKAEDKEGIYRKGQEMLERFRERSGSLECNSLIGHDISSATDRKEASEAGVFKTVCPRLVREAVSILLEMGVRAEGGGVE